MDSRHLRASLDAAVMAGVTKAIERAVEKQTKGAPEFKSQFGIEYVEKAAGIELPENFADNLAFTGQFVGNAFGAIAAGWLARAAGLRDSAFHNLGYRGREPESKIREVIWRIEPEWDIQHTQMSVPDTYEGETFKDFITDGKAIWGPWVAKFYMRFHVRMDGKRQEVAA